jgi:amino-acid N-acetyltransferase
VRPRAGRPAAAARGAGVERLVLLTTRTADWFEQRGFKPEGAAHASELLPDARRAKVDAARNSRLFSKDLRRGR